jgi:predicted DNA-binding WGR domain protein
MLARYGRAGREDSGTTKSRSFTRLAKCASGFGMISRASRRDGGDVLPLRVDEQEKVGNLRELYERTGEIVA